MQSEIIANYVNSQLIVGYPCTRLQDKQTAGRRWCALCRLTHQGFMQLCNLREGANWGSETG